MTPNLMPPLLRRGLAGVLAVLIGLGPLADIALAAPPFIPNGGTTSLADEPLNVKVSAKPNIILTVDDSTSMLSDFLPDYVVQPFCRDGTGAMNAHCGFSGAPINVGSGGNTSGNNTVSRFPPTATAAARTTPAAPAWAAT
jgi:hypothetical protein